MSKHTPGPWRIIPGHSIIGVNDDHQRLIVYAPLQHTGCMKDWPANATLIAAAPEMYEAMQHFVDRVERGEVRSKKTYALFKELITKIETS